MEGHPSWEEGTESSCSSMRRGRRVMGETDLFLRWATRSVGRSRPRSLSAAGPTAAESSSGLPCCSPPLHTPPPPPPSHWPLMHTARGSGRARGKSGKRKRGRGFAQTRCHCPRCHCPWLLSCTICNTQASVSINTLAVLLFWIGWWAHFSQSILKS